MLTYMGVCMCGCGFTSFGLFASIIDFWEQQVKIV